jgi:transcriptional regulator with XRE-family HTH domain
MRDRIKSLLQQLGLSPSEFADRIGVQRSSVSHVISGRNKPSIDFLEKILNVFPETDSIWLITGRTGVKKALTQENYPAVNEYNKLHDATLPKDADIKKPAPAFEEPVDNIIVVYKNNTFRLLRPSGQ